MQRAFLFVALITCAFTPLFAVTEQEAHALYAELSAKYPYDYELCTYEEYILRNGGAEKFAAELAAYCSKSGISPRELFLELYYDFLEGLKTEREMNMIEELMADAREAEEKCAAAAQQAVQNVAQLHHDVTEGERLLAALKSHSFFN